MSRVVLQTATSGRGSGRRCCRETAPAPLRHGSARMAARPNLVGAFCSLRCIQRLVCRGSKHVGFVCHAAHLTPLHCPCYFVASCAAGANAAAPLAAAPKLAVVDEAAGDADEAAEEVVETEKTTAEAAGEALDEALDGGDDATAHLLGQRRAALCLLLSAGRCACVCTRVLKRALGRMHVWVCAPRPRRRRRLGDVGVRQRHDPRALPQPSQLCRSGVLHCPTPAPGGGGGGGSGHS